MVCGVQMCTVHSVWCLRAACLLLVVVEVRACVHAWCSLSSDQLHAPRQSEPAPCALRAFSVLDVDVKTSQSA
jgi:hypothetical protein